jgi:hypothetical protein
MNVLIVKILDVKFFAACSDVAVLVEVAFQMPIDRGHQAIAPEVELAVVD